MEQILESLIVEMKEIQPYLRCHDLQNIGRLNHKWLGHVDERFWAFHLKTLLGTEDVPRIAFPLTGFHLEYFYLGLLNRFDETKRGEYYRFFFSEQPFQRWIPSQPIWRLLCGSRPSVPYGFLYMNTHGHIDYTENFFYFEIRLLKLPEPVPDENHTIPCMSIGVCTRKDAEYIQDRGFMTGWTKHSIGFHTDDLRVFHDSVSVDTSTEAIVAGDVIGCGIDVDCESVFFTKNGHLVYEAQSVFVLRHSMFPILVCDDDEFVFDANFGAKPFSYMRATSHFEKP